MRESARRFLNAWRHAPLRGAGVLLAGMLLIPVLLVSPAAADDGELQLDPAGGGYVMRLGKSERIATGEAGTLVQIAIDEPPGAQRDAPVVAKVLRTVPPALGDDVRADVIVRRDGARVLQLAFAPRAREAREIMLALYWHDGTFRRTYDVAALLGAPLSAQAKAAQGGTGGDGEAAAPGWAPTLGGAGRSATQAGAPAPTAGAGVSSDPVPSTRNELTATPLPADEARAKSAPAAAAQPATTAAASTASPRTAAATAPATGSTPSAETARTSPADGPTAAPGRPAAPAIGARPAESPPEVATVREGERIVVRSGDSLWQIAERVQLPGLTQHQFMVGLYENNPGAFAGSANRLRAGTTLVVPAAARMQEYAAADAINRFREISRPPTPPGQAVPLADARAAPPAPGADARTDAGPSGRPAGSGRDALEVGVDGDDPALARERDTAYAMALAEAQSRIEALTEQVEQLETLIQLKDLQIAEAKERLGLGDRTMTADARPTDPAEPAGGGSGTMRETTPAGALANEDGGSTKSDQAAAALPVPAAVAGAAGAAAAQAAAADAGGQAAAIEAALKAARQQRVEAGGAAPAPARQQDGMLPVQSPVPEPAAEESLLGSFNLPEGFWTFAAGIVIALIVVLIVLRLRKRRQDTEDTEYDDDDFLFDDSGAADGDSRIDAMGDSTLGEMGTEGPESRSPRTKTPA